MIIDPLKILHELYDADDDKYFDDPAGVAMFDKPTVAIADANDPWFAKFKQMHGPEYWTPQEALASVAPGATAKSVICWSLPTAEAARKANRSATDMPSRLWAWVRWYGEQFNTRLRKGLVAHLQGLGASALAPAIATEYKVFQHETFGLTARWSERHTAFVAGLGTFGISGGLITAHGMAHRLGSIVCDIELPVTTRPYGDEPFAWCLREAKGTCGACIARCPAGSIGPSAADRDKEACRAHTFDVIGKHGPDLFGFEGIYGCGLCQTGVPCEFRNPVG